MSEAVVETHGLTKHYGAFVALNNLSIRIHRGEVLGFIGPNGAGKTTTIKILVGLNKPTAGHATIAGLDCTRDSKKVKRLVGYMPDTFGGYENMRVREYLDFFGAAFRIPRRERASRIDAVLEQTNAASFKDLPTEALSHGMKQKVALSRTLLHEPQVLILDEPANGLDPLARIEMREVILRLANSGKTVLVSSHILPELARICTSVAIITRGTLRAFGTLDEVLRSVRQARSLEIVTLSPTTIRKTVDILRTILPPDSELTPIEQESMIRVKTSADVTTVSSSLTALIQQGIAIAEFRELTQDLEDAYLSVTAQSDNEEPSATASSKTPPGKNA